MLNSIDRKLQPNAEHCTAVRLVLRRYLPAMGFDDCSGNREPDPHAVLLGRKERIKDVANLIRRNARTCVGHGHFGKTTDEALRTMISRGPPFVSDMASIPLMIRLTRTC